jgi:hypothetical protein
VGTTTTHPRLLLLVAALAIGGCKKDESKAAGAQPAGSAAVATPATTVKIFVDDQQVGTLALEQAKLWPRLDTLVPMSARRLGTWQAIVLGTKVKKSEVTQPSSAYPELVPALFANESGSISFGMFDAVELAKHGKPSLREDAIESVKVTLGKNTGRGENEHQSATVVDPAQLKLMIKTPKGAQELASEKLLAIPREASPGESESKGWKLSTLLAQAGITGYQRLVLTDANGVSLTLEQQDLDPASAVPFVKLNRQGSLRFRVFRKQGDTWQPSSDLRGLTTVEVLK